MEINVLNIKGQETGRKVTLNESIFGIEPNDHVIYLDVKRYLADQRQGTAKAKERSEHAGSTRKLGRQKGGGGARHGDINSPLLRGGGRVFGPRPRDYRFKLNKKVTLLARKSALSYKAKENAIIIVEDFNFEAPKTKDFLSIAKNLNVEGKKLLMVLPESNKNVYLSARNLQRSEHAGSTRKLGRQKGGGGARHGDINSPLLRGGGRVFGPTPRDYGFKLNKKVKALARRSALSYKAQENAIIVVEDFNFEAPKTKEFVEIAKNLKVDGKKVLMVLPEANKNVYLSARNLQKAECIIAANVNTYKVLNADVMVITESSLKAIDGVLAK